MKSRDRRELHIPQESIIAGNQMMHFASDRACAVIGRPRASMPVTGSAVCIEIAGRYFLATAAHVVEPFANADLLLLPRGELNHKGISFIRRSHPRRENYKYDVAWLEVELSDWSNSGLRALTIEQTTYNWRYRKDSPVLFIQGFPSREAIVTTSGSFEPLSLCLASTSVDPGLGAHGAAIEYPPQDPADIGLELIHPGGFSGGGMWTWHPLSVWPHINVGAEKLIGLITEYDPSAKRLISVGLEHWFGLVAHDNPELRDYIQSALARREIRISPNFSSEKLRNPTLEDLIDVFEDRMRHWLIEPAKVLAPHPFGQVASLNLLLSYFEGVWSYIQGQADSRDNAEIFFTDCFVEVFTPCGRSPDFLRRIGEILFEDGRDGFAHDTFFRERIYFGKVQGGCLDAEVPLKRGFPDETGDINKITLDAEEFLAYVEGHFGRLILALRDPLQEALRSRFRQACKEKWKLE
jgi:hypothetical protein